jgi:hypothetical protein
LFASLFTQKRFVFSSSEYKIVSKYKKFKKKFVCGEDPAFSSRSLTFAAIKKIKPANYDGDNYSWHNGL